MGTFEFCFVWREIFLFRDAREFRALPPRRCASRGAGTRSAQRSSMEDGVPAILLLLGTTFVGAVLGKYWIAARHYKRPLSRSRGRLLHFAIIVFMVSVPFWSWAVYKMAAEGDRDYGVGTFAAVWVTACAAYREAYRPMRGVDDNTLRAAFIALVASQLSMALACALVAANYLIVLVVFRQLLPLSFQVYLGIGVAWWSLAMVVAYILESRVRPPQYGSNRSPAALRRERQLLAEQSEDSGEDDGEVR